MPGKEDGEAGGFVHQTRPVKYGLLDIAPAVLALPAPAVLALPAPLTRPAARDGRAGAGRGTVEVQEGPSPFRE